MSRVSISRSGNSLSVGRSGNSVSIGPSGNRLVVSSGTIETSVLVANPAVMEMVVGSPALTDQSTLIANPAVMTMEVGAPALTDAAGSTSITFVQAGGLGAGTSDTISGGSTTGMHALCLFNDDDTSGSSSANVTFNSVAADQVVFNNSGNGGNCEIHIIDNATAGDISITTFDGGRQKSYALLRLTGFTRTGFISDESNSRGPLSLASVPDGAAIIAVAGAASGAGGGDIVITATDTTEAGSYENFPSITVNTGTKSGAGTVTANYVNGANRLGFAAIALPTA